MELRIIAPRESGPAAEQIDKPAGAIEDRLSRIASQVPEHEWDSLPADLSDQLDHHLYGTPRE